MASQTLSASATAGNHSTTDDTTYVNNSGHWDWSTLGNMAANDGAFATANAATASTTGQTYRLDIKNWGFTIPTGATIDGISVSINGESSNVSRSIVDAQIRLIIGGTPGGDNKAANTWTSEATNVYGGASVLWGLTPTYSDINASTFGVAIQFYSNGTTLRTMRVDHVQITVYYTESGGNQSDGVPGSTLSFSTFAPNDKITGTLNDAVPGTTLTFTTFAPGDARVGNQSDGVPNAQIVFTTFAPLDQIVGTLTDAIPSTNLTFTTFAPSDLVKINVQNDGIPNANLTFTAFAPLDQILGTLTDAIPSTLVSFTTFAPDDAVVTPGAVVQQVVTAGGGPKPRTRRKLVVIGNKRYYVESVDEVYGLLDQYRKLLETEIKQERVKSSTRTKKIKLLSTQLKRTETRIEKVIDEWEEEIILMMVA